MAVISLSGDINIQSNCQILILGAKIFQYKLNEVMDKLAFYKFNLDEEIYQEIALLLLKVLNTNPEIAEEFLNRN